MRFSKEGLSKPFLLKLTIVIALVAAIVIGTNHYGLLKKNCSQDKECFDEAFKKCKPAKITSVIDSNYYSYAIDGKRGGSCKVRVDLIKMGVGTSQEVVTALEGKGMTCNIPLERMRDVSFDTMPDILNYCTGPLKEAMYEQIIAKMYALIIKNLGPIVSEVKEFYKV